MKHGFLLIFLTISLSLCSKHRKESSWQFTPSVARAYATAAQDMGPEYYEYKKKALPEDLSILSGYDVFDQVGSGGFGTVFAARQLDNHAPCVVKTIFDTKARRIRREQSVLEAVQGGPNIVGLHNVVTIPGEADKIERAAFVFDVIEDSTRFSGFYSSLSPFLIKYYLYQLLRAVDHTHSRGVVHKDIKPGNIMIDHRVLELTLIDFGVSDFYLPMKKMPLSGATRNYKAPEMLLRYPLYDYSFDMWSVGCVAADIMLLQRPFFKSANDDEQLDAIAQHAGSDAIRHYVQRYNVMVTPHIQGIIDKGYPARSIVDYTSDVTRERAGARGLDLIARLLVVDHQQRMTAAEAMDHPYFDEVRGLD